MIKKTNKYFLLFSITLFLIGIVLAQVFARHRLTPSILGAKDPAPKEGDKAAEDVSAGSNFDLFLNPDFLKIQESLFTQKAAPMVTFQKAVQIHKWLLPPQNVHVYDVKNGRLVAISWDKQNNAPAKIKVLRATVAGAKPQDHGETSGTAIGYYDTDVEIGQKYYYTLVSVGKDGKESKPTGPYKVGPVQDLTPPMPPKDVTFKNIIDADQHQAVQITWEDPDSFDLEFINIYRSTTPGEIGKRIAQIAPGEQNFIDKDFSSSNTYYYLVVSLDKAGNESPYNLVESQMGNSNPFMPLF